MWNNILAQFGGNKEKVLKTIGFLALGLVVVIVLLNTMNGGMYRGGGMLQSSRDYGVSESAMYAPSMPMGAPSPSYSKGDYGYEGGTSLSYRNVAEESMPPVMDGYATGNTEAYEVKNYSAHIETRNLEETCGRILALKSRTEVIFENSNAYDEGCSYTFKVVRNSVAEIYRMIEDMNPKNLSENAYTIKRQVDDYTSEIDIYKNQLARLDATLDEALASYENITALATKTGDTESLARIIENKLNLIERLTNSRLGTQAQLDRIARAKADALDQLAYTYFTVSVTEEKYIDGEALVDSWKQSIRTLVWNVNAFVQDITLGFVELLFVVLKYALYGVLLLLVAKVGWRFVKGVWTAE